MTPTLQDVLAAFVETTTGPFQAMIDLAAADREAALADRQAARRERERAQAFSERAEAEANRADNAARRAAEDREEAARILAAARLLVAAPAPADAEVPGYLRHIEASCGRTCSRGPGASSS